MPRLADLATKKFTTKDFEEALARNLAKKKKKDEPLVKSDTIINEISEPESIEPESDDIDLEAGRALFAETPNDSGKNILDRYNESWINQPLTDLPSRASKKISEWIDPERGSSGLRSTASAFAESVGDVLSGLTSPTNLALTATGVGAYGAAARNAPKLAKVLGRTTQALSVPQVASGVREVATGETTADKLMGAANTIFGGLGFREGSKFSKLRAPKIEPVVSPKAEPTGLVDKAVAKNQPPKPPPTAPASTPEVDIDKVLSKASPEDLESLLYNKDPSVQEAAAREMVRREEQATPEVPIIKEVTREPVKITEKYDEFGNRVDDKYLEMNQDPRTRAAKETSEEMTARLFPGMSRGSSKFSLQGAKNFLADEKGELDLSKLFQGEEDLGYSVRTNDPDTVNLGELPDAGIDLNQAAIDAGADLARRVRPTPENKPSLMQRFLTDESGEFNPDFMNRPGSQEFSPDLVQQADEAFGGTSPRFEQRVPRSDQPQSSFSQRLLDTLADESGSVPREPRLVRPDGSTVTPKKYDMQGREIKPELSEDARIQQLTDEAMAAVERERSASLKAGEIELNPEELARFREQMQSGEKFAEDVDRSQMPLLRSKDYMEIPPESSKSSARRASGLWGGVNDTFQQPQPRLENPLTPPKVESGQSAMERFIRSLYKDESGELNLEGLFGEAEPNQRPMPLLPDEASLQPNIPIQHRAAGTPAPEQSLFGKIKDAPKGLMSMDLPFMTSAAFRQAKPLAWTTDWFKAWGTAAKAYGGDEAAYKVMEDSWKNSKYFKPRYKPKYDAEGNITGYKEVPSPAEEIGVHLAGGKFGPAEEQIRAQLAEQIPGWGSLIKRSNRAYQAFINDLRVNKTTELLDQLEWTGTDNDKVVAKALGEFVNDATGRGSLKWAGPGGRQANLERIAPVLQNTMWSPRLFAANTKFLNPFTYTSLPDPVRRQYIGGALRMAGTWITFAGLAKMAGAEVNLDPTNSDFGKIKIGNTRVDPAGGMQQLMVFLAREAPKAAGEAFGFPTGRFTSSSSGKTTEYGEGAFPKDRASVAEDFATSKLDPMSRLAYDIMRSSSKRPVHLGDRFVQMSLPIMAQDIADAMKEDPSLERLLGTALGSSTGMGVNTYGKGERISDPVFTDSIEQYMGQPQGSLRGTIGKW